MQHNKIILASIGAISVILGSGIVGFAAYDHASLLKLSTLPAGECGGCGEGTPNCNIDNSAAGIGGGDCPPERVDETVQNCDGTPGRAKWSGKSEAGTSASSITDLPDNVCAVANAYTCTKSVADPKTPNIYNYKWKDAEGDCGNVSTCRAVSPATSPDCKPTPPPTPPPGSE